MDVYLRVRRAVMVDGMIIREVSRVFGLHRDTVAKYLAAGVRPPRADDGLPVAVPAEVGPVHERQAGGRGEVARYYKGVEGEEQPSPRGHCLTLAPSR